MSALPASARSWVRRLRLEALLWIALAAFAAYRIWPQLAAAIGAGSADTAAPSFQITTLDGRSITGAQLRGQVVLVNFWATWCLPCRVEMPGFEALYKKKRSQGFIVLGVSTDGGGSAPVSRFLAEHGITYPVGMETGGIARQFGGVTVLPTSFLIDRRGRIRSEVRGIFLSVALESAVDRLLKESPAPSVGIQPAGYHTQ